MTISCSIDGINVQLLLFFVLSFHYVIDVYVMWVIHLHAATIRETSAKRGAQDRN